MCSQINLQAKTKTIAIVQFICSVIVLIALLVMWLHWGIEGLTLKFHLFLFTVSMFILVSMIVSWILWSGAKEESITKCSVWFQLNRLSLGLWIFMAFILAHPLITWNVFIFIVELGGIAAQFYFLYVVKLYMNEVKEKEYRRQSNCNFEG